MLRVRGAGFCIHIWDFLSYRVAFLRLGFIGQIVSVKFLDGSLIASLILVRLLRSKFFFEISTNIVLDRGVRINILLPFRMF